MQQTTNDGTCQKQENLGIKVNTMTETTKPNPSKSKTTFHCLLTFYSNPQSARPPIKCHVLNNIKLHHVMSNGYIQILRKKLVSMLVIRVYFLILFDPIFYIVRWTRNLVIFFYIVLEIIEMVREGKVIVWRLVVCLLDLRDRLWLTLIRVISLDSILLYKACYELSVMTELGVLN